MKCRVLISIFCAASIPELAADDKIDFNRDVRPILADKCFHCHGPDSANQKSDLRFDTKEHLFADYDGVRAVVPGDLEKSELHFRIHTDDEIGQMPPPDSNRSLTAEQKKILKKKSPDFWRHCRGRRPVQAFLSGSISDSPIA